MKIASIVVFMIVVAAGLCSTFLVSQDEEIAYLLARDGQLRSSRAMYRTEFSRGNVSPFVASPLVRINLETGNFEEAEAVLQRYLSEHPTDDGALASLARLYDLQGRSDEFIGVLRERAILTPTRSTIVELREAAIESGDEVAELSALRALRELDGLNDDEALRLGRLASLAGRSDEAVDVLTKARASEEPHVRRSALRLISTVLMEGNGADEPVARELFASSLTTQEQSEMVWLSLEHGRERLAKILIGDPSRAILDPDLAAAVLAVTRRIDGSEKALELARPALRSGTLPPEAVQEAILAAVEERDAALVADLVHTIPLDAFRDRTLVELITLTASGSHGSLRHRLEAALESPIGRERIHGSAFLREAVHLAKLGRAGAGAHDSAHGLRSLTVADSIALVDLAEKTGNREAVARIVERLDRGIAEVDDYHVAKAVVVLLENGLPGRAWAIASREYARRGGRDLARAWALAAIADSHRSELGDFLRTSKDATPALLGELAGKLQEKREFTLAIAANDRFLALHPGDPRSLRRKVGLLLDSGRIAEGTELLNRLPMHPADLDLITRASESKLGTDAVGVLGRRLELLVDSGELSSAERRGAAYLFLERFGARGRAERLFKELADGAGASSADLQELLHLWGPRPPASAREWLIDQARNGRPEEFHGWLRVLGEAGAYEDVVRLARGREEDLGEREFSEYLTALSAAGDKRSIVEAFERRVEVITRPEEATALGRRALELDLRLQADIMLGRSRALGGTGRDLALLALDSGRGAEARQLLEAYFSERNVSEAMTSPEESCSGEELRAVVSYGEFLIADGADRKSRSILDRMIEMLERSCTGFMESEKGRISLLLRSGRRDEAIRAMESLPSDERRRIRGELANVLLDDRKIEEARRVLSDEALE